MKTKAFVVAEKGAAMRLQEIDLADPSPNEILIEVVAASLCATGTKAT